MGGMPGGTFEAMYRAMPVAFIDKQSAENGDKIFMPPSALERLGAFRLRPLGSLFQPGFASEAG